MKGYSVKSGTKRPTSKGAGMTKKGIAKYRRENPGSKLQTAVTEKKPKGKQAARRKSYCARSAGQMKKFPKAAKNPNSRLRQARKRWRCQMRYFAFIVLWICYLLSAFWLTSCLTIQDPLTDVSTPQFNADDMKCQGTDILWCEGRNRLMMSCECVPSNMIIF